MKCIMYSVIYMHTSLKTRVSTPRLLRTKNDKRGNVICANDDITCANMINTLIKSSKKV